MKKLLNLNGAHLMSKTELLSINGGKIDCLDAEGQCTMFSCACGQPQCRPAPCDP